MGDQSALDEIVIKIQSMYSWYLLEKKDSDPRTIKKWPVSAIFSENQSSF